MLGTDEKYVCTCYIIYICFMVLKITNSISKQTALFE